MAVDDGVVGPPENETSLNATVMDLANMQGIIIFRYRYYILRL